MSARSMELRAIRTKMMESPPPPPKDSTLREWFAGLALACPELMKDVPMAERAKEAVRLADELVAALMVPRSPTKESMAGPTPAELKAWEEHIKVERDKKDRATRATIPDIARVSTRKPTMRFEAILPPPSDTRGRPTIPPPAGKATLKALTTPSSYFYSRDDLERING